MNFKDAGFIVGMIALAVIIALGAWFGLFSPALASKTEADVAAAEAAEFNDLLEIQLAQKQAEAQKLPEYEAQLVEMSTEFPQQDLLAEVRRDIDAVFLPLGVIVDVDALVKPEVVAPGSLSLVAPATAAGRVSYVEGLQFQDLYVASITLTVKGDLPTILRGVSALQMDQERYYLVESLQSAGDADDTGAASYSMKISYFVLFDSTSEDDPGVTSAADQVPQDLTLGSMFVPVVPAE